VLQLGFELTIICLKTFHSQSQRGGKFEIHEMFLFHQIVSSENGFDIIICGFMRFLAGYFNILACFEIMGKKV
jgi:hypothetical protein